MFTAFFNPYYLLTYACIFAMLLVGSYSEFWKQWVSPFFTKYFFQDCHLNSLIISNHQIRTYDQISHEKSVNYLRE